MINAKFEVLELEDQISIIKDFLSDKNSLSNFIADFFKIDISSPNNEKDLQIENVLSKLYKERINDLKNTCIKFQNVWNENSEFINKELFNIFGKEYNFKCTAYVNLNPVWPRFLEDKNFHVNVDASDNYLLLSSVHEIVHFIWFEIWKNNFPEITKNEYEFPHLTWLVSEIAIEPIFRFSNLKGLCGSNPAYDYFYTDKIDDKTIAEIANEIYQQSDNINHFQKQMYDFFKNNPETKKLIK